MFQLIRFTLILAGIALSQCLVYADDRVQSPAEDRADESVLDRSERVPRATPFLIIDPTGRPQFFDQRFPRFLQVPRQFESMPMGEAEALDQNRMVIGAFLRPIPNGLHGLIGIKDGHGLWVTDVLEGGPAEKAGIQENDVLLSLDGQPLQSIVQFREQLEQRGSVEIDVELRRGQQTQNVFLQPVAWSELEIDETQATTNDSFSPLEFNELDLPRFAVPQNDELGVPHQQLGELNQKLDELRKEVLSEQQVLRELIEQLQSELKQK